MYHIFPVHTCIRQRNLQIRTHADIHRRRRSQYTHTPYLSRLADPAGRNLDYTCFLYTYTYTHICLDRQAHIEIMACILLTARRRWRQKLAFDVVFRLCSQFEACDVSLELRFPKKAFDVSLELRFQKKACDVRKKLLTSKKKLLTSV